jgi:hypothetical protein
MIWFYDPDKLNASILVAHTQLLPRFTRKASPRSNVRLRYGFILFEIGLNNMITVSQ